MTEYPETPQAPPAKKGLGIAAMVLGIVAVVVAFIPILGIVGFILGLVAVVLGIIAAIQGRGRGQAIAGIITGALSLITAGVVTAITGLFVSAVDQELQTAEDELNTSVEENEGSSEEGDGEASSEGPSGAGVDAGVEADGDESVPDSPEAYSALTIQGDEQALPEGDEGEVSVVAISEPDGNTSFPIILQNRTDQTVSRIEVTGRATGPDGASLGTGASQMVSPNVVPPDGYAFGYVYVDSSEMNLPEGASISDLRVDFTEGIGGFENIVGLDVENLEELPSGDLTGDAMNPHDEVVTGPISIGSVCLSGDERVTHSSTFAESDTVSAGESAIWTISNYSGDSPECEVRLVGSSGYSE